MAYQRQNCPLGLGKITAMGAQVKHERERVVIEEGMGKIKFKNSTKEK